jgi:hypothetical protein
VLAAGVPARVTGPVKERTPDAGTIIEQVARSAGATRGAPDASRAA